MKSNTFEALIGAVVIIFTLIFLFFGFQSMRLNNTTYNNTWIDYNEIQKGGSLHFKMDSIPNKDFGNSISSKPFSLTNDN